MWQPGQAETAAAGDASRRPADPLPQGLDMTDINENRKTAYNQLCTSYHAIDDFRAKLLGFLPLVTGGGLILLTGRADQVRREFFGPIGILGIAVTTGLLAYELNGIKKCRALITNGKTLEKEMDLRHGQFIGRPDAAFSIMTKPFAAALVYPAVLAAWVYLAFFFKDPQHAKVVSIGIFIVGFLGILLYDQWLQWKARGSQVANEDPAPRSPAEADQHASTRCASVP
jgi:hypothetical protein